MMWIIIGPPVFGSLFVMLFGILLSPIDFRFLISLIIQLTGAYFIYQSKKRSISEGVYTRFGTKGMTQPEATKYAFGYILFATGILAAITLART